MCLQPVQFSLRIIYPVSPGQSYIWNEPSGPAINFGEEESSPTVFTIVEARKMSRAARFINI